MKILALIPARGGSKRLPGKNIKKLGDLPLIAWTIRAAQESRVCSDIVVSTDDTEIAAVAVQYGATVPGLRPAELATDTAGSVDVAIQVLDLYESQNGTVDGLLLLQPTSPFRSAETIKKGIKKFIENNCKHTVVSISPAKSHPAWCFRQTNDEIEPFLGWSSLAKRSQDLEQAWVLNGTIYVASPTHLRSVRSFFGPNTKAIIIENEKESVDIDTIDDFNFCSDIIKNSKIN